MNQLKTSFRKNGYDYVQAWRDEKYAIYEQTTTEGFKAFEVIKIGLNKSGERFGKWFDESEAYPSSEQWGTNGFTVPDLESAKQKVDILKEIAIAAHKWALNRADNQISEPTHTTH